MDEAAIEGVGRRRWPRRLGVAALALFILFALAVALLWPWRAEFARSYIDAELARRGVHARYQVSRIGFGSQIFENLVIGDPRRPDLVARHVEVQILFGLRGPRVGLITARGVRIAGRVEQGRVRLGEIDKLLPPPSGAPFRLPDQRVDVRDAALDLATPAGRLILAFAGRGNLADGFRGGIALASPELRLGNCVLTRPVARLALRIEEARPRVNGPAAMAHLACGGSLAVERPLFALRAILAPGLDHWRGQAATRAAALGAGAAQLAGIEGRLSFDGDAGDVRGRVDIAASGTADAFRAARIRLGGDYTLSPRRSGVSFEGQLAAQGLTLRDDTLAAMAAPATGMRSTPLGPIAEALSRVLLRAGRGGAGGEARFSLVHSSDSGRLGVRQLRLESASGARLAAAGGQGIEYYWPSGHIRVNGDFTLSGGGFPDIRLSLSQPRIGGPIRGSGRVSPMQAGGARLALGAIAFTAEPDGRTNFRTAALLDGPLGGGHVTRLALPIAGHFGPGGFAIGESCVAAGFAALRLQSLALGPSRLRVCPAGRAMLWSGPHGVAGGAELRSPRLAGRLGTAPIALAADRLRIDSAGLAAARLAVRLGPAGRVSRLDVATLNGRFAAGGIAGRFEGLSGDLANVPLLIGEGRGSWRLRGSSLALDGRLTVADRQRPVRFHPLAAEDFRLSLAGNHIHATGTLSHPASRTRVALAAIDHDLASGTGRALLDVPELRFTRQFQPEALTPLTVGVVALVHGSMAGQGRIEWDGRGARSSGRFTTAGLDLAAPFGPVQGLATTIDFTDLLGLVSAPHQEARVRLIQPGIDVYDGVVRYQLRPNYHVAVESARWPLAGGTLTLEPTILDFSRESTKYLTFRVDGLDAARFIQQLEFSNISATGTYDGVIPMQFTHNGGRVVGGRLTAREGGGTLSYVGELSDRDLGAYGILAFDALKSLRYSRLNLSLDGALDGEFITRVEMDGVARNPAGTREPGGGLTGMLFGRVLHQLARVPFHFNIRIEGRFRALIATARSFQDPSDLIRASLPQLLESRTAPETIVQPQESEPMR